MTINGRQYDYEDCTIILPGSLDFCLQELNYGYGRKNYGARGSMTMDADQYENFLAALKYSAGDGGIYDHKLFNIISSYADSYQALIVDTLPDVKITKLFSGYNKQGALNDYQVQMNFIVLSPIKWNGVPAKKG